jgi:hypothetical protein
MSWINEGKGRTFERITIFCKKGTSHTQHMKTISRMLCLTNVAQLLIKINILYISCTPIVNYPKSKLFNNHDKKLSVSNIFSTVYVFRHCPLAEVYLI